MNWYEYYDKMQELCLRAQRALEAQKSDSYFVQFYEAAGDGFFNKKNSLKVDEAVKPAGILQEKRYKDFKFCVEGLEEEAAYFQKGAAKK